MRHGVTSFTRRTCHVRNYAILYCSIPLNPMQSTFSCKDRFFPHFRYTNQIRKDENMASEIKKPQRPLVDFFCKNAKYQCISCHSPACNQCTMLQPESFAAFLSINRIELTLSSLFLFLHVRTCSEQAKSFFFFTLRFV